MSQTGVGVMIQYLSGNSKGVSAWNESVGKTIENINLVDDAEDSSQLEFTFTDGSKMGIRDDGQSCCEHRYMTTDDDLLSFVHSKLLDAEIRNAPEREDEYGVHEVRFLIVTTSVGQFTLETHNEHNGYYGGFYVQCHKLN